VGCFARIYLNGFSSSVTEHWRSWLLRAFGSVGLKGLVVDVDCPVGNMPSFTYMKQQALSIEEEMTVVMFLEDDYLLQPTAIVEMMEVSGARPDARV
jgi:hypothetical protein